MSKLVKGLAIAAIVAFGVGVAGADNAQAQNYGRSHHSNCYGGGYNAYSYRPIVPSYVAGRPNLNYGYNGYRGYSGYNGYRTPYYGNSFYGSGLSVGIGVSNYGVGGYRPGFGVGTGLNYGSFSPGLGGFRF